MIATAAPAPTMQRPVQHILCERVFDLDQVHPVVKYQDCTAYQCPYCGVAFDDRPEGRGGIDAL